MTQINIEIKSPISQTIIQAVDSPQMRSSKEQYRHRVSGGPRSPARPTQKKGELQAHADMLERMVNRSAERIRVLEALHTLRVEEAGLILATVSMLYRRWREEQPDEPDRGSSFMHWVERLRAEEIVSYAMGSWDMKDLPLLPVGADDIDIESAD